jgi:hypothetical protein
MILFVNGFIMGCEPYRPYWSSSRKDPNEFIEAAKRFFRDDHVIPESFVNGSGDWFGSKAWSRQSFGRKLGLQMMDAIQRVLHSGETVKIVSHSMGAATTEGIIESLTVNGVSIEKVLHLAPANASKIRIPKATAHIDRLQINASGDLIIEGFADPFAKEDDLRIPGVKRYGKVKWDPWKLHSGHMNYLRDRKLPFDLDSHFDLKTYAYVFDWASDLASLTAGPVIGQRDQLRHKRNVYEVIRGPHGTIFERLFLEGRYLKYLEPFKLDASDKFTGPKLELND